MIEMALQYDTLRTCEMASYSSLFWTFYVCFLIGEALFCLLYLFIANKKKDDMLLLAEVIEHS